MSSGQWAKVVVRLRTTVAVAALATLGALIVASRPGGRPVGNDRFVAAMWILLAPLLITMLGLVRGWHWSRWVALAGGIAVLPWAGVIALAGGPGAPAARASIAPGTSALLILSLLGRGMFERFEGRARRTDWSGRRMAIVRWTINSNLASILVLYLFVAVYEVQVPWHASIPACLLLGLVLGVLALAHGKTVGLLGVALCCFLFVPAGGYFVWQEARYAGEAVLFIVVFLPGVLTGWVSVLAFGSAARRYLSAD